MRLVNCDVDGVLADFDGAFEPLFGFDHRTVSDEVMWAAIDKYGTYFRDLPPCPGALEFFDAIRNLRPTLLTACPVGDRFEDIARQKRAWIREHIGNDVRIVFTPGGKTKQLYMHQPGDILIDDFERNIQRWNAAGGVGILHTGDFIDTRLNLIGALWGKNPSASGTSRAPSADHKTTSPDTTTATATASAVSTTRKQQVEAWATLAEEIAAMYPVHLRD